MDGSARLQQKGYVVNKIVRKEDRETVVWLLRDKLGIEIASNETNLLEYGMIDSVKFVDLVYGLEQEFGIAVPIEALEIEQFRTVMDIVRLVAQLKNGIAPVILN